MKKLLFVAALGVAGLMSANSQIEIIAPQKKTTSETNSSFLFLRYVGVESDCGAGGTWWVRPSYGNNEPTYEEIDDMRQLLNEAFCN